MKDIDIERTLDRHNEHVLAHIKKLEEELSSLKRANHEKYKRTRKLEAENKELKEYSQHKQYCKLFGFTSFKKQTNGCTCGLDKLLEE